MIRNPILRGFHPDPSIIRVREDYYIATSTFEYGVGDCDQEDCRMVQIAHPVDASFLSDEACDQGWFTGAMIGLCTQDLTGAGLYADYDYFEVKDI